MDRRAIDPEADYRPQDVSALIPGRPSLPTIWRWLLRGLKSPSGRRRLPSRKVGGRRFVRGADLLAWLDYEAQPPQSLLSRSPSARDHAAASAAEALDRLGI